MMKLVGAQIVGGAALALGFVQRATIPHLPVYALGDRRLDTAGVEAGLTAAVVADLPVILGYVLFLSGFAWIVRRYATTESGRAAATAMFTATAVMAACNLIEDALLLLALPSGRDNPTMVTAIAVLVTIKWSAMLVSLAGIPLAMAICAREVLARVRPARERFTAGHAQLTRAGLSAGGVAGAGAVGWMLGRWLAKPDWAVAAFVPVPNQKVTADFRSDHPDVLWSLVGHPASWWAVVALAISTALIALWAKLTDRQWLRRGARGCAAFGLWVLSITVLLPGLMRLSYRTGMVAASRHSGVIAAVVVGTVALAVILATAPERKSPRARVAAVLLLVVGLLTMGTAAAAAFQRITDGDGIHLRLRSYSMSTT